MGDIMKISIKGLRKDLTEKQREQNKKKKIFS